MNILRCRAEFSSLAAVYDRRRFQSLRRSESAATVCRSPKFFRRGGRAVDRAGLENRKAERPREFESHPLRPASRLALRRTQMLACAKQDALRSFSEEGPVHYVYLIESRSSRGERYVRTTTDLKQRL